MIVRALVILPASCQVEVPDDADEDTIREAVLDYADKIFEAGGIKPVIHDSDTHPDIID